MDRRILIAVAGVSLAGLARVATAAPYASGISNAGGTVTFTLNEDAGNVTAIVNGTPQDLGALTRGTHSFATGGATNYSIVVGKLSGPGYNLATGTTTINDGRSTATQTFSFTAAQSTPLQVSDDHNLAMQFAAPRGVVINNNPASPTFGRIYVSNAAAGISNDGRISDKGIYVMNADQTGALSQASDPSNPPLNPSLPFGSASTASPWRIELGRDDGNLYIADDTNDGGTMYVTDPDVSTGTLVLAGQGSLNASTGNHGRIMSSPLVTGSLAGGNLLVTAVDGDLKHPTSAGTLEFSWINQWALGAGPTPSSVTPTFLPQNPTVVPDIVANVTIDLDRGPDGKYYLMQNRAVGSEAGLFVLNADGSKVLWNSLTVSRALRGDATASDETFQVRAVKVTADGRTLVMNTDTNRIWVVPLIDGIPDLVNAKVVNTAPTTTLGRDISLDIAGNIYTASSGQGLLRIYSPGGPSVVTTNSNGTVKVQNRPEWTGGSGNYSTGGNWLMGYVPNAVSETAVFGSTPTAPINVNVDAPLTLAYMYFDNANKYTISGGSINLAAYGQNNGVGEPRIQTYSGSHEIASPLTVNSNLQVTTDPGTSLTISGPVTYAPAATALTKAGTGTLSMVNYRIPTLNVNAGTAKVIAGGGNNGTSKVQSLNIAGGTGAWTGTLDVTNNGLVIDYTGTSPLATVQDQIKSGYNGGSWTGTGITSSTAAAQAASAHRTAVGYMESTGAGTFMGQAVDPDALLVRYTYAGDGNLDGKVDLTDFTFLAANFNKTGGATWNQGDYNYDGNVDLTDFTFLASNFNQSLAADAGGLGAAVPEPTSMLASMFATASLVMARSRRRGRGR